MQRSQSLINVANETLPPRKAPVNTYGSDESEEEEMVLQFPEGIGIPMSRLCVGSKTKSTPFQEYQQSVLSPITNSASQRTFYNGQNLPITPLAVEKVKHIFAHS